MKNKILIDANVIIRVLLNDDFEQAALANQIIQKGAYTLPEVLDEVAYVLKRVYKIEKNEIVKNLYDILEEIEIKDFDVMRRAIEIFSKNNLSFVDCILIAHHEINHVEVFSFDKALNKRLNNS